MDSIPFTERRNSITTNIDTETSEGIVEMLHRCNLEVFNGYEQYHGLLDETCLTKLDQLVPLIKEIFQNEKGVIVMSGCGTSGRIGFLASAFFNELCGEQNLPPKYRYIIAAGNSALVTSIEASEDDPVAGATELQKVTESFEKVLFIGITCGLSAPFVGGQLEYCLDHPEKYTPVLMGFNPVSMARKIQVPKWSNQRTFYDIATRMETTKGAIVLNPIVGPEPISGSSRMKGGTATKVMLDTMFLLASVCHDSNARTIVEEFRQSVDRMSLIKNELAEVVQQAGNSLLLNSYIRYFGPSTFGVWGMIDASECVPTYNSDYNDIRGFVTNDYFKRNLNAEPANAFVSPALHESTPNDVSTLVQALPSQSLVIVLDSGVNKTILEQLQKDGHHVVLIKVFNQETVAKKENRMKTIDLTSCLAATNTVQRYCIAETLLKLTLNTISTGAHILKGKVYQNIMIDVRVSNIKLFYRAVDIIKSLSGVDPQTAERALIQSIHHTDEEVTDHTVEQHILAVANNRDHVVPIALFMCLSKCSYKEAKTNIDRCPKIRDICLRSYS